MPAGKREKALEQRRLPKIRLAIGLVSAVIVAALFMTPSFAPWLLRFEYSTADWRTAFLSEHAATQHPKIALVVINDETLKDYPSSPVDRGLLSKIVRALDAAGARAIGLDILFLKKTDPERDQQLLDTLHEVKTPIVLGALDQRGDLKDYQQQFQTSFLQMTNRPVGYLNLRHERDDVVRYTASPAPQSLYPKSFARLLAETAGVTAADKGEPIAWILAPSDGSDTFLKIPAQDLIENTQSAANGQLPTPKMVSLLSDRIVLVGGDFPLRDRHRTPLSVRHGESIPGVAIHAYVLAGMLDPARAISELTPGQARLLLMSLAVLGFLLGWLLWRSTVVEFLGWGTATAILIAVDAFCFKELNLLLPFTLALVAWVAGLTAGKSLRFVATSYAH